MDCPMIRSAAMATSSASLAVLGGAPAFAQKLYVGSPNIGDRQRFYSLLDEILDRRWLTNGGAAVLELEGRIAEFLGVKHFFAMCNGTVALEVAVRACDMKGEVICPSFTFVATAHALEWQRITPVFVDIDPTTHLLDPEAVEAAITPRTTGIVAVHTWGQPCYVDRLQEIADRHGLKLVFDAAHAFCCSDGNRLVGGFGDAEIFSFHATKFFNTGEGGGISTNDDELALKIRLIRNFGFRGFDNVESLGTNGKMSELNAALGLCNLDCIEEFVQANRENFDAYKTGFAAVPAITMLPVDAGGLRNYQHVVVEVEDDSPLTRDEIVEVLWAENVVARRYFFPGCHRMQPYADRDHAPLSHTERATERTILLPSGTAVTPEIARSVCAIIEDALLNATDVRKALSQREPMIPPSLRAF